MIMNCSIRLLNKPQSCGTKKGVARVGPLAGVRVLDMTTVLMGPYATLQLADMGADIIKVEPPEGDIVRQIGPGRHPGMGPMFLNVNRSKRSIALDLKQPAGRDVLLRLAATCDVFIYNVRPQAMARLGLAYEDLAKANPGIIYVGVFGYGQDGPYAARPAYDDLIQGACAIPTLLGKAGDGSPRYVPLTIADRIVGLFALSAVLAALRHRDVTGQGQRVDVPMFETMANFVLIDHLGGLTFDPPLDQGGYARLLAPERRPYRTKDGYVCALIYNDKQWRSFFDAIGRPEMLRDPRFHDHASRTRHIREIYAEVAAIFAIRTSADWINLLAQADIPYTPLNTITDLIEDAHLAATDFISHIEHPTEGRIKSMRTPIAWSDSKPDPARPAPALGEHSREILQELGLTHESIEDLFEKRVVHGLELPTPSPENPDVP
jgi:crotonobetainyl-CoA:carnitine CoA-transferase CaiB-like acyl-CoA transferase